MGSSGHEIKAAGLGRHVVQGGGTDRWHGIAHERTQVLQVLQMDTTVRNLDEKAYRELKARAALEGRPIGETLSDAIRVYLRTAPSLRRDGSLAELRPAPYAAGTERLSEEIDAVVYGAS